MNSSGLIFGIYPLSMAGTPVGLAVGPEDDFQQIQRSIQDLRGSKKLYPRMYLIYTQEWEAKMLTNAQRYLQANLLGDVTIGCGDWTDPEESDMGLENWLRFIRKVIHQFGPYITSLQITNEPNLSFMEGSKPYIIPALIEGVIAAKKEAQKRSLPIKVGFGSVPEGPASVPNFWENLSKSGDNRFFDSVDFVGHNFYIDVFDEQPLDLQEIPSAVEQILRALREKNLTRAGIPHAIPIRVTENGWPTGKNPMTNIERTYERQATVLETIISTVYRLRSELNISHYQLFGLRDADSSKEDLFHQFGIMRDDYSPKPAYQTFKKLVQKLGG